MGIAERVPLPLAVTTSAHQGDPSPPTLAMIVLFLMAQSLGAQQTHSTTPQPSPRMVLPIERHRLGSLKTPSVQGTPSTSSRNAVL